jgi:gamma-glutamyltranspeptidase / glutathione hydrolase
MSWAPFAPLYAARGMVCSVDHQATSAGVAMLQAGGSAVDAAVAAGAVLAVTTQHMCGLGGDLLAVVHRAGEDPVALDASGRAGSGADPDRLRAEGATVMPAAGDIRAVPVPGCVDGWVALHERFGRLDLALVLAPAVTLAEGGFAVSVTLARAAQQLAGRDDVGEYAHATTPGAVIRRPGVARMLRAVAAEGRDGAYLGEFGEGLVELGGGEYTEDDLRRPTGEWRPALGTDAWGLRLWTVPPVSQGYLALAGGWLASRLPLPADADDAAWAHLTIEAARLAAFDRPEVLHEHADGGALLAPARLQPRLDAIESGRAAILGDSYAGGGTIALTVVDAERTAVSYIQSNASGFGCGLVEPRTGVFLHNRGIGFSLDPGHPAEYGPGRRPPHTLSPLVATNSDGSLHAVLGTMGGDAQPQILLQLLARLAGGVDAAAAVAAGRWTLSSPGGGAFSTWDQRGDVTVELEQWAPASWDEGLRSRGHRILRHRSADGGLFGHAHVIRVVGDALEGAADPRALGGAAAGY